MATKSYSGWECKTDTPIRAFTLRITTRKTASGLSSWASCHKLEGNFEVHRIFHDFYAELILTKVRVTEKAVNAQHGKALEMLEVVKEAVVAHYNKHGEM